MKERKRLFSEANEYVITIGLFLIMMAIALNITVIQLAREKCSIEFTAQGGLKDLQFNSAAYNNSNPFLNVSGIASGAVSGKATGSCIILAGVKR